MTMTNPQDRAKAGLERREAEKVLEEFLNRENEDKVFVLKGDWGVGKTHLVRTFLSNKKEYYYGSVFGVSSIDELKIQLCSNFQPINIEVKTGFWRRFNPGRSLKHSKEMSGILEKMTRGIVTSSTIALVSNVLVNNMLKGKLICIDDIERSSKKLRLDELLGFIESLAEEHKCKIILIYYEDKFEEEAKKTLIDYREKVIDIEIKLDPNADENFSVGFGKDDPDKKIIFEYLSREHVQTNNIRVLKKLQRILEKIRPHIKEFLPIIRKQIIEEAIFITLAKFDRKFPIHLDRLLSLGDYQKVLASKSNEDENLYLLATKLGYSRSPISNEIVSLVETSVCDYKKLVEAGRNLNARETQHRIQEKLTQAYNPYSESFGNSEEELRQNFTEFLDSYLTFLGLRELENLKEISQAIDLDLSSYKKAWLEHQIDHSDNPQLLNDLRPLLQEFPDLTSKLKERNERLGKTMSITQVLSNSFRNRSWSEVEANYLDGLTVEDYKQWLLEKHPDKDYLVKQGLRMGEKCPEILKQAIIELAQKSRLNAFRAKYLYGVDIDKLNTSHEA